MPDNDKILSDFFRTLGGQKKEEEPPARLPDIFMSPLDPSQQGKGEPLLPYDRRLLPDWAPSNLILPHPGGDGPHQREVTLSDKEMKAAVEESARLRRLAEDEALAEKQFELRGKLTVSVPRSAELDKELDEINREEYLYGGARKGLSAMRGDATDRDLNKWSIEIDQKVGRFLKKANVRELKHYGKSLDEIVEMEREDARKAVEANKAFELRARGVDSPDIGPRERGIHEQIFDSGVRRAFSPLIGPTERQVAEWEAEGVSERGMMQRVGLVPKAFTPSDWYTEWSEPIKEDVRGWAEDNPDSSLKAAAAGITNTAFDLFGVVGTSPGGVLLLASGAAAPAIAGESGVALYHANVARAFSVDLTRAALEHAPGVVDTYKSSDATKVEKAEAIAGEAALILFAWLSRQSSKKQFEKAHNIKLEDIQTRKDALEAVDTIKENILKEEAVKEFEKEMGVKSEEKTDSQKLVDEWSKEAERSAKEKFSERETQRAIERSLMGEREPVEGSKPLEGKEMTPVEAERMVVELEKAAKEFEAPKPVEGEPPWEMTEAEFTEAEAKGMGVTWLNAWKTKDGRILTSASREHGDMVDPTTGELVVGERGWTWKGLPKEDTFIGTADVGKAGGDFWMAYKARAPKPEPVEVEGEVLKSELDLLETIKRDLENANKPQDYPEVVGALLAKAVKGVKKSITLNKYFRDREVPTKTDPLSVWDSSFDEMLAFVEREIATLKSQKAPKPAAEEVAPKPVEGEETSLAAQAAKDAAAAKVIEDAAKIEKAITEPVVPEPLAEPPKPEVLGTEMYDKMLKDEAIRELEDGSFVWEGQGRFVKVLEDRFGEQPFWRLTKLDPTERAYTPELPELPVTPKTAEEVAPKPEDIVASEAKEVEKVVKSLERERTIKEAITEESWSDTHERTDVTNVMGVKKYTEKVADGTIEELPDGSYKFGGERYIKEPHDGNLRTTKLSKKATVEAPVEPTADPPKPPTEGAPPESAMPGGEAADAATRMKGVVRRQAALWRKKGRGDLADRLEADPLSYYDVVSSKAHIEMVRGLDMQDVEALIAMEGKVPDLKGSILGLLEGRKLDILGERAESATPENAKAATEAYELFMNALSTKAKSFGQFNAQMREIGVNPRTQADVVDAMLEANNAPKLSAKDRAAYKELVKKQREIKEELEKAHEEYWENPTEENFLKAHELYDNLFKEEIGKVDILSRNTPRLWTDLTVQILQGNLLTPATILTTNPFGNIVPIPPRAAVRGFAATLVEIMDEFMLRRPKRVELEMLEKRLADMAEESPKAKKIAKRIAKLLDLTNPLERNRLTGFKGARDKWWRGTVKKGFGWRRFMEAREKPKGEKWDWTKHDKYDDALKAILWGQRDMQYEVESTKLPVATLNALDAGSRVWNTEYRALMKGLMENPKDLAAANKLAKDLAEAVLGLNATGMFRALAALDLPFRHGEHHRILREYGLNRYKWESDPATGRQKRVPAPLTEDQIKKSQIYPGLFWDQKTLDIMWNEAAKATYQNENRGTEAMSWINQFIRGAPGEYLGKRVGGPVGDALYLGHRGVTPFQKTLINVTGENLAYIPPFGMIDTVIKARQYGVNSREAKLSFSRMMVGGSVYTLAQYLINKSLMKESELVTPDIMAHENDPRFKYLMEKSFPSAYLNMTATKRLLDGGGPGSEEWREGDKVWNLEKMGPPGQMLLTMASVAFELQKLPEEERKKIEDSFVRLQARHLMAQPKKGLDYALNQSFAQGARDLIRGYFKYDDEKDKDRQFTVLKPYSKAIPTLLLPNTLDWFYKQELQIRHPLTPQTLGTPNPYKQNFKADTFIDSMRLTWDRRLSVLGIGYGVDEIPALVDMWGSDLPHTPERIKTEGKLTKVLMYNMFNVASGRYGKSGGKYDPTGKWIPDPGASEVYRAWRATQDPRAVPTIPSRFITIPGAKKGEASKTYKLNKEQYYKYSKRVGQYRYMGCEGKYYQASTGLWKKRQLDGVYTMVTTEGYIGKDGKPALDKFETVNRLAEIYRVNSGWAKKDFLSKDVKVKDMEEVKKPSGMSSVRWDKKVLRISD